jgi:hypothetical protein
MAASMTSFGETVYELPPLILYPFSERVPPATLLENSKAALILSGVIPGDGSDMEELERRLLTGRYGEIRMLFFIGKDVFRWVEQCLECTSRIPQLGRADLRAQSFAALLTMDPPGHVREKLVRWGVADYAAIFSRAIGLHAVFAHPPALESVAEVFLRGYHTYADALYRSYMQSEPHAVIGPRNFRFDLYASGEYSRMLETEWGTN